MSKTLRQKKLLNSTIFFVPENIDSTDFDWENDWQYFKILGRSPEDPGFRRYISTIDQYPDKYFDCIIIDGRERIGCLVHAISKLNEQGIIIFDDSARDNYKQSFDILKSWVHKSFRFGLGQTTFFAREKKILELF